MQNSDIQQELKTLFAKRPQVIKPGLERIKATLPYLNGIEKRAPKVIVGGTNGKGTTAGYLWQMISAAGVKAGLFTSPHLVHFSERFSVSGKSVSDEDLVAKLKILRAKIPVEVYDDLSFFEVNTILALQLFADEDTEVDILEVGLGGRWDSTNVCDPDLSIITSVGLDHMEFLGHTVEEIAAEKAGIMRPGRSCLWSGARATAADRVIKQQALAKTAWLYTLDDDYGTLSGRRFFYKKTQQTFKSELPPQFWELPKYLRQNFITALAAYSYLVAEKVFSGTGSVFTGRADRIAERVLSGAATCPPSLRGRFQMIELKEPFGTVTRLLLDACHNPDGAATFAEALTEKYESGKLPKPLPAAVSILKDKQHGKILDILRQVCKPIVLFPNQSERSWSKSDIEERHRDLFFADNFRSAVERLASTIQPPPATVVVCGSVHLMGQVLSETNYP